MFSYFLDSKLSSIFLVKYEELQLKYYHHFLRKIR